MAKDQEAKQERQEETRQDYEGEKARQAGKERQQEWSGDYRRAQNKKVCELCEQAACLLTLRNTSETADRNSPRHFHGRRIGEQPWNNLCTKTPARQMTRGHESLWKPQRRNPCKLRQPSPVLGQRWGHVSATKTHLVWACILTAIITMIIGFNWAG